MYIIILINAYFNYFFVFFAVFFKLMRKNVIINA
nr:MAG TPA: hypothetical protein [Caudoviricetes sp.]DAP03226.1 MAG TPA: hypothetical protein [Caudoviricetes sp.]